MTHNNRAEKSLAWLLAAAATLAGLIYLWTSLARAPVTGTADALQLVSFGLILPILYAGLGALIVSRQPGNRVGWLMIISALDLGGVLQWLVGSTAVPPPVLTPGMWLALWFGNWSWVIFIFPIFLIPLYFPDGRPPSPRWGWVFRLALGLGLFFALSSAFSGTIGPIEGDWTLPNPIGFLPDAFFGPAFLLVWGIGLLTVVAGSVASLIVRYRRARAAERDQIQWLLFAGILFFIGYGISYFMADATSDAEWSGPLFMATLMLIPCAIAIAILRHRLYDINLIIRRTLQYTIITGALAAAYFGGIVVFQALLGPMIGDRESPFITVLTTLGIAALFNPLRRGTQRWIDHRFFRAKYDAEQELGGFARSARDEVDLDRLALALLEVVGRTMQPARASLWIADPPGAGLRNEGRREGSG